jgi:hypothetical protein
VSLFFAPLNQILLREVAQRNLLKVYKQTSGQCLMISKDSTKIVSLFKKPLDHPSKTAIIVSLL